MRRWVIWLPLLFAAAGCSRSLDAPATSQPTEGVRLSKQPDQTVSSLTETDRQRLSDQRAVVEEYLADESRRKYESAAGKLGTIRAILEAGILKEDQTYELQCLGIVLGDAFVADMGMEWVMVEDEYGRDPAVRLPTTSIILYPMTKRGEDVDVFELYCSSQYRTDAA